MSRQPNDYDRFTEGPNFEGPPWLIEDEDYCEYGEFEDDEEIEESE